MSSPASHSVFLVLRCSLLLLQISTATRTKQRKLRISHNDLLPRRKKVTRLLNCSKLPEIRTAKEHQHEEFRVSAVTFAIHDHAVRRWIEEWHSANRMWRTWSFWRKHVPIPKILSVTRFRWTMLFLTVNQNLRRSIHLSLDHNGLFCAR